MQTCYFPIVSAVNKYIIQRAFPVIIAPLSTPPFFTWHCCHSSNNVNFDIAEQSTATYSVVISVEYDSFRIKYCIAIDIHISRLLGSRPWKVLFLFEPLQCNDLPRPG